MSHCLSHAPTRFSPTPLCGNPLGYIRKLLLYSGSLTGYSDVTVCEGNLCGLQCVSHGPCRGKPVTPMDKVVVNNINVN
jgi:hypothetical protein